VGQGLSTKLVGYCRLLEGSPVVGLLHQSSTLPLRVVRSLGGGSGAGIRCVHACTGQLHGLDSGVPLMVRQAFFCLDDLARLSV
jgi:hypothetical protein